jgi:hypothetical protein
MPRSANSSACLVLADQGDRSAMRLCHELRRRSVSVELLTFAECTEATCTHFVSSNGASWSMTFDKRKSISSHELYGVISLRMALPAESVSHVTGNERNYAYQELASVFCSMLAAVPGPKLNVPWPLSINGRERSSDEWLRVAHLAGLITVSTSSVAERASGYMSEKSIKTVLLLDEDVFCSQQLLPQTRAGLQQLVLNTPERILSVELVATEIEELFLSATPLLDIEHLSNSFIDALAKLVRPS